MTETLTESSFLKTVGLRYLDIHVAIYQYLGVLSICAQIKSMSSFFGKTAVEQIRRVSGDN